MRGRHAFCAFHITTDVLQIFAAHVWDQEGYWRWLLETCFRVDQPGTTNERASTERWYLTETAKRTLVLNTLCNEERKESFARGRKQERDKTSAIKERKEIFGQGKREKTRQVQAQGGDYFNSKNIPILWSLR
jgi:hypothetical protein